MKPQYDQTIEFRGRLYRYDPDFDCFYAVQQPVSDRDRLTYILALITLTAIAIIALI